MDVFAGLDPLGGKGSKPTTTPSYPPYGAPPPQANMGGMPTSNFGSNGRGMNNGNPMMGGMPASNCGSNGGSSINMGGMPGMHAAMPPMGGMPGMNMNMSMGGMPTGNFSSNGSSAMHMGGMPGMTPMSPMGGMNMGGMHAMPGMMNGMGGGMNMAPNGMGMPPQGPPAAQPVMYDNIKNLLEKKAPPSTPTGADGGGDMFSCFGGGDKPSSRTSSGTSSSAQAPAGAFDPFGGSGAPPAPTSAGVNLSIFGDAAPSTSSGNISTSSSTPKNSALADRLRGSKRQTQEAQRASLNVGTYANSNAALAATPSIKKQLGGADAAPTGNAPATTATSSPDNLLGF
ncbi:hypothetical protein SDRG_02267 [Saprolegnia diclina VS20]|uniref:Uncharacterized protein n=1 Tax=Saprolegnia diclina (strain VS20) TaxID=1156394 RepID=T0S5B9_SAPDV|nr:hypothetical protein SDRG_02267 [Saprolegnia diclina VS20]EQC40368.1 hypothetical protein SDRG_02267 [Saprolegnia diclina VS20]|eukprot:XP_008606067.1 hypothetical protein SDRG_02267 [Saprolegnia diclina VS20]